MPAVAPKKIVSGEGKIDVWDGSGILGQSASVKLFGRPGGNGF